MKKLWAIGAILLLAYLSTGLAQVGPEERGVVRRFGRVVARPGPGLWVGWPWGIDRIDRVSVKTTRQVEVGFALDAVEDAGVSPAGQFLTGDQNLINIRLILEYAIDDREGELENFLSQRDSVDGLLIREAETLSAEWIAAHPVDAVLLTGRAALPAWLMPRLVSRTADLRLGILLQRISVDQLTAPNEVRSAFEAVNQAQTAISVRENEARLEANRRLRDSESTAFKLKQQAASYRIDKLSAANAEAEAFTKRVAQYRELKTKNPDILAAIWWDEMGRVLIGMRGRGRVDLLDQHLGANGLDITQFLPPKKK
jgi:modulator of FtsH protease HflK